MWLELLCRAREMWASIYVWMYGIVVFCGEETLRRLVGHWRLVRSLTESPEAIRGLKCGNKYPETRTTGNVADGVCRTV